MNRLHQPIKGIGRVLHHKYILFRGINPLGNKPSRLINQHFHVLPEPGLCVELHALLELAFVAEDGFGGISVAAVI